MVYLFARIFYEVRQRTEDVLGPHGLTSMQFTILITLNRWAGMSSADLSRRFNVTPQTMGEMISNLERRGFLVRTPDQANRRALRLSLTDEGLRMLDVCNGAMDRLEGALLEAMPAEEVQALKRQLRLLHNHLGLTDDISDGAGSAE
ncbi:MAG: MarR family transcriptional regulator [Caulobacteraceae bacterium]